MTSTLGGQEERGAKGRKRGACAWPCCRGPEQRKLEIWQPHAQESTVPVARILIRLPHQGLFSGSRTKKPSWPLGHPWEEWVHEPGPHLELASCMGWTGSICLFPSPVLNYKDKMPFMLVQAELTEGLIFLFPLSFNLKVPTHRLQVRGWERYFMQMK